MKLTILNVGESPFALRDRYPRFSPFFERMFSPLGMGFTFDAVSVIDGAPFPNLAGVEAFR